MTLATATATLREAVGEQAGTGDALERNLQRTASAVSSRIEQYAPGAPQAAKDEALVRAVAWLLDTQGAERVDGVPGISMAPAPAQSGPWFRSSGAMSLLSAFKVRRAGVIV